MGTRDTQFYHTTHISVTPTRMLRTSKNTTRSLSSTTPQEKPSLYVTYWSSQLARGTEQTAQCQSTRLFSHVAIGKGSGYLKPVLLLGLRNIVETSNIF